MQTRTTVALTVISLTVVGCNSDTDSTMPGQLEVNQVQGPGAASPFENADVVVSGISLVAIYQASFASIVQSEGVDGLLAFLDQRRAGSSS